jgi:flagellar hook-length control protein FliK
VNIQPQVIKDPEIIPFIVDNPASMLKRTNEVSAQMMMLRQAFESLRTGSSREAGLGIGTTGAPAGGGNLGSGAAGGAFKGAPNDPSAVREKTQQPLSRSATYRLLERVNATLKEAARARDGKTISLHLEPVDLGRIKVDVSLKDGALHARLTPESAQVGQALREHAHELQAALRKLGLDVEKVTVNVSADAQGKEFSPEQQNLGDGKGFQDNRNNMPHGAGQLAENTFGNELADRGEQVGEQVEVALKEAKTSSALSWRDNWVA